MKHSKTILGSLKAVGKNICGLTLNSLAYGYF